MDRKLERWGKVKVGCFGSAPLCTSFFDILDKVCKESNAECNVPSDRYEHVRKARKSFAPCGLAGS